MRYLIVMSTLLASCVSTDDIMYKEHIRAIKDKEACYQLNTPEEISGMYCLVYKGKQYDPTEYKIGK